MTAFNDWLDARDGEAIARAWSALPHERPIELIQIAEPGWFLTSVGIARFAAAFLGWPVERLAWLTKRAEDMPPPIFDVERETKRSFVEQCLDDDRMCESMSIHEERDGERGVQLVSVMSTMSFDDDYILNHTTPIGTAYRVFDRATATGVSITTEIGATISVTKVAKIGDVDLATLDVFCRSQSFQLPTWTGAEPDDVRALIAELASTIDPLFAGAAAWPARELARGVLHESGPRGLETTRLERTVFVKVRGLPWGYEVDALVGDYQHGVSGSVTLRLPISTGKSVIARLAQIPGVQLG